MTNTLNTPIEALEQTYPLRVTRYEFAGETGGDGRFRGGCGLIREFELTDGEATFVLLSDRHVLPAPGMLGGKDGVCGKHTVTRADGAHALPAKTTLALHEGERIAVQTPGGGGYGPPSERAAEARAADRRSGL